MENYLILLVLTLLFFRNVFPKKGEIIFGSDLLQTYYYKFVYKKALLNKKLPVWNDYIYSGTPFLAHPYNGVFYPPNLLFLLPINIAYTYGYILHVFLAGSFMFMLTHSLLSSICFMFSGFIVNRIWAGHYEVLTTSIWIPLIYLLYITNHWAWCAFFLAIQFFAGHNQTSWFTVLILLCGRPQLWRSSATLTLFGLFALIQLIPTCWFIRKSTRANGLPFKYSVYGSFPPSHLLRFIYPDCFGNFLKTGDYGDPILGEVYWEHTYYIGLMPLILALSFFDYRLLYGLCILLAGELIFRTLWKKNILH